MDKNIAIIGAGIVGLATALKLKEQFLDARIVILEKNPEPFSEASRYNSGVIHSGIHQNPAFLKSRLAREGGPILVKFCEENGVPYRKAGMIVAVAGSDMAGLIGETKSLWHLYINSRKQGIPLKFLTKWALEKMEPGLRAAFGLYMPDIWVIDQPALGKKLCERAMQAGIAIECGAAVESITRTRDSYGVIAGDKLYSVSLLVNSAGVHADKISALAGFPGYTIYPYRGEYYEVVSEKRNLIKNTLIYPALKPGSPFKGIHITKTVDGRMLLGPSASKWDSRTDDFTVRANPQEFVDAVRKFLPGLEVSDVKWLHAGLRAKINPGLGEDDFIIKCEAESPSFINLVGIESPGFTSSFAIARYVANMVKEKQLLQF